MKHLAGEVRRLVDSETITPEQGESLLAAAAADAHAVAVGSHETRLKTTRATGSSVLEVLGYVGGALLLGAIIFLAASYWDDLDQLGRNLVAIAALVISAGGGLALILFKVRREVGYVLLALGCYAAGFCYLNFFEDDKFIASSLVVLIASAIGGILLRAGAFVVSGWSGGFLLALSFVLNFLGERTGSELDLARALAVAFIGLGVITGAIGFVLARTLSWSLAGVSGWAAGLSFLLAQQTSAWFALLIATVTAALLLAGFIEGRRYVLAVLGCLILLSLWPAGLYQIFESALGVAIGLIAAGAVLIIAVVVLSRRSRQGVLHSQT